MKKLFTDLELNPQLLKALDACGYTVPTPIQQKAIPMVLAGKDIIASANTGTGKTAAFVLPILEKLAQSQETTTSLGPRALILSPTRELATQILDAVRKYSKFKTFKTLSILGGMPYREQLQALSKRVDLVVATPGRLIDHLQSGKIDLSSVEVLVLDEADRMLDLGFQEPVQEIAQACPKDRQTLLFTATFDKTLGKLTEKLMRHPERIDIDGENLSVSNINQSMIAVDNLEHKYRLIEHLATTHQGMKAIIFASTKRDVDQLADHLYDLGLEAAALHGDMRQRNRTQTVQKLKTGRIQFLVATDVAARGIDISDITHVINFDLPRVAEDYVHRIGRTGRAGATGIAFSFFSRGDIRLVKGIERYISQTIPLTVIPGFETKVPVSKDLFSEGSRERRGGNPRNSNRRDGGGSAGRGRSSFGDKKKSLGGGRPERSDDRPRSFDRPKTDRDEQRPRSFDRSRSAARSDDRPRSFDRPKTDRDEQRPRSFDRPKSAARSDDRPRSFDRPKTDRDEQRPRSFDRPKTAARSDDRPRSFDRSKTDRDEQRPRSFDRPKSAARSDDRPRSFDRPKSRPEKEDRPRSFDRPKSAGRPAFSGRPSSSGPSKFRKDGPRRAAS